MSLPSYNPVPVTSANIITFIVSDPLSVGFSAIRTASPSSDGPLEIAANAVSDLYPVPNSPLTASQLLNLINATEFNAMTTAQLTQLSTIFSVGSITVGLSAMQTKLNTLFDSYPTSLASIQSAYTQSGSPWQYYFGVGQSATNSLLDNARNSGSGNNF